MFYGQNTYEIRMFPICLIWFFSVGLRAIYNTNRKNVTEDYKEIWRIEEGGE